MATNGDPNQTSILIDNGFRPTAIPVDSARIDVRKETQFDFQNGLAIPSRGILADLAFWISLSAALMRVPVQLVMIGYTGGFLYIYLGGLIFLAILLFWILSNAKTPIDGFYRCGLIFAGYCVATHFGWLV